MTRTPNELADPPKTADLLDDVLRRVRVESAVFLWGDFTAPWSFESTDEATFAEVFAPEAKRLVMLHLAIEGSFRISLDGDTGVHVEQGEAVVLPYSDVHTMGFPEIKSATSILELVPPPPWSELPVVCRTGGGGAPSRVLCGYLHCDDLLFDPILRALPRLIHVRAQNSRAQQWREASLRYVVERLSGSGGKADLLARIPELVLVDCLQQYADTLRSEQTGWLAALHDPVVGRALRLMHAAPEKRWTVEELAQKTGTSRSLFADRFTHAIGLPPMRYLASWRLQVAADLVRTSDLPMPDIAARVGYESEAAFSRAFKRQFGLPPVAWRQAGASRQPVGEPQVTPVRAPPVMSE